VDWALSKDYYQKSLKSPGTFALCFFIALSAVTRCVTCSHMVERYIRFLKIILDVSY